MAEYRDCRECIHYEVCLNHEICPHYAQDANAVPLAEWTKSGFSGKVYCSRCKFHPFMEHKTKYCPECGAQMKGAE